MSKSATEMIHTCLVNSGRKETYIIKVLKCSGVESYLP